jgi:hypothetical protein
MNLRVVHIGPKTRGKSFMWALKKHDHIDIDKVLNWREREHGTRWFYVHRRQTLMVDAALTLIWKFCTKLIIKFRDMRTINLIV